MTWKTVRVGGDNVNVSNWNIGNVHFSIWNIGNIIGTYLYWVGPVLLRQIQHVISCMDLRLHLLHHGIESGKTGISNFACGLCMWTKP